MGLLGLVAILQLIQTARPEIATTAPAAQPEIAALPTVTPAPLTIAPTGRLPSDQIAPPPGDAGWAVAPTAQPLTANQTQVQPGAPPTAADRARVAALDGYLRDLTTRGIFNGAVLVARGDSVLLSAGYGLADAGQNVANTPETRFRLASLTKSFTAMAILQLQARGSLHVQDPICDYLPNCPPAWQPLTIRHLLTHTAGIPDYTNFLSFEATEMLATTTDELVSRFQAEPLLFEPGQVFAYSNSGYVLLGLIIEQASGQPYAEFLHETIFAPLQMDQTGYDANVGAIAAGQALGYTAVVTSTDPRTRQTNRRMIAAPFLDTSTLYAAGALYSTVEDLYRWDRALAHGELLPNWLQLEMFTPTLRQYGYGWFVRQQQGRQMIGHSGYITGFSNYMVRYPDERITIIVLSNLQTTRAYDISQHLAGIMRSPPPGGQ